MTTDPALLRVARNVTGLLPDKWLRAATRGALRSLRAHDDQCMCGPCVTWSVCADELGLRDRRDRLTIQGPAPGQVAVTPANAILIVEASRVRKRVAAAEAAAPLWDLLDAAGWEAAARLAEDGWAGTSSELAATAAAISG